MHLTTIYLLAAWSAVAVASANLHASGQAEFNMGVLLPRQQARVNLQSFTGALGGASASAITNSGDPERPFEVDGDTFVRFSLRLPFLPGWSRQTDLIMTD
jgi:hypothetical protein